MAKRNKTMKISEAIPADVVEAEVVTKAGELRSRLTDATAYLNANIKLINMQLDKAGAAVFLSDGLSDDELSSELESIVADQVEGVEKIVELFGKVFEQPAI